MENQGQNQNINSMDYLNSISSVAPEPMEKKEHRSRKGLFWIVFSAMSVFGLAIAVIILSIISFSGSSGSAGDAAVEQSSDPGMFEVVNDEKPLPDLGTDYEAIGLYSEGLVAAIRKSDGKTVFLDSSENVKFELGDGYGLGAYEFHDGRIPVQCTKEDGENGFGYLGVNGELAIACEYSYAASFEDGVAQIIIRYGSQNNGQTNVLIGKIDTSGNILEYEEKKVDGAQRF